MRIVYHLFTVGIVVYYVAFAYVPACVTVYRLLLPGAIYAVSYTLFRRLVRSDPGQAPLWDEEVTRDMLCRFCSHVRSPTTKHCHVCNMCVDGFDHHCDVLDICVGAGNVRAFRSFLLFHSVALLYATAHTVLMLRSDCMHQSRVGVPVYTVLSVLTFSFGSAFLLFWIFHICLACWNMRTYDIIRFLFSTPGRREIQKRVRFERSVVEAKRD